MDHDIDELKAQSCFVATAVYGNIDAPEVQVLREFRDTVLSQYALGRKVIDLYYGGFGEKAAKFIQEVTPSAIPVIKQGLDFLVDKYQAHKK